jgi:curved DNA-binding protein CbpA
MGQEKRRFTDYFDLLEVGKDTTKEDVQKAFITKASIWHPDKAENDEDREYFTKVYQDLQVAYKILSNDNSRRQYIDAQQTTDMEFKNADRDVGYQVSDQFQQEDGKFDANAFKDAFDQTRDDVEAGAWDDLKNKYTKEHTVNDMDYQNLLTQRDVDRDDIKQQQVFSGTGKDFDANTFNRAFDVMKETQPGNGVQLYEGQPQSMFSSGGLEETDNMSGLQFNNGMSFTGQNIDNLVLGQSSNPGLGHLDLEALNTGEVYGVESKMSSDDMMDRINSMQAERDQDANMGKDQYIIEPTEIENLYADLFAPLDVEGLEAPKQLQGQMPVSTDPVTEPKPVISLTRNPTRIKQKIAEKKRISVIDKAKVSVQIKNKSPNQVNLE